MAKAKSASKDKGGNVISGDLAKKIKGLKDKYKAFDKPEFIKTGSLVLDSLFGGGIPRGAFILWSSGNGIGKSTGSLFIAKSYCFQGFKVLYLDFEGGVNQSQLDGIGLTQYLYDEDTNPSGTFYGFRVQTYADAEVFLDNFLDEVDLVIIDSVTAILPEKMKEKSVEDIQPGLQARMTANLLLKYKAETIKKGASWIMINQLRTHIRFIGQTTDEEAGGNALKFYADYRVLMKKAYQGDLVSEVSTASGKKKAPFGAINEVWCLKSRYSRPFIPLNLAIIFGKGIANDYAYKEFLDYHGCIKKEGSWYTISVGDAKGKFQGENKVVDWIGENRDLIKKFVAENGGYKLIFDGTEAVASDEELEEEYDTEDVEEDDYEDTLVRGELEENLVE